jgi:hypothetical protein
MNPILNELKLKSVNEPIRLMVKCLNQYAGLEYNRYVNEFRLNGATLSNNEIKRFIMEASGLSKDSFIITETIKRLKLKATIQK